MTEPSGGWPAMSTLVPHQGPMCLLDDVIDVDAHAIRVRLTPRADDLFAETRGIPVQISLEWMAQASAAWSTLQPGDDQGAPRQGMLLGARQFRACIDYLPLDQPLEIRLEVDTVADNGLGAFQGTLYRPGAQADDNAWLAQATLSVLQTPASSAL